MFSKDSVAVVPRKPDVALAAALAMLVLVGYCHAADQRHRSSHSARRPRRLAVAARTDTGRENQYGFPRRACVRCAVNIVNLSGGGVNVAPIVHDMPRDLQEFNLSPCLFPFPLYISLPLVADEPVSRVRCFLHEEEVDDVGMRTTRTMPTSRTKAALASRTRK